MSRLGEGNAGLARSLAIAAVAPGGSFAVGSALVLDEVKCKVNAFVRHTKEQC